MAVIDHYAALIPWTIRSIRVLGIWIKRKDFSSKEAWRAFLRIVRPRDYSLGANRYIYGAEGVRETRMVYGRKQVRKDVWDGDSPNK